MGDNKVAVTVEKYPQNASDSAVSTNAVKSHNWKRYIWVTWTKSKEVNRVFLCISYQCGANSVPQEQRLVRKVAYTHKILSRYVSIDGQTD